MEPNAHPTLVSVIMPAYNASQYISQAIGSMLGQEYAYWELLVIDDGSTDDTADIVKGYNDPRIRYFYQKNHGQAAALNRGLDLAQGDYITTLDVDDWYPPTSLGERVKFLDLHPDIGVVYGDGFYCDVTGEPFLRFTDQMPSGISGDVYDVLIVSPFYGTGATVLERKGVIDEHKLRYDESIVWCQDWDFYIRLAEVAKFGFVNSITIQYRIHDAGMTVSMPTGRRLDSLISMRNKVMTSARFKEVTPSQKAAFFYDYLIRDLSWKIDEQEDVFASPEFKELPKKQQSRLLRIAAIDYLLDSEHTDLAKRWLRTAWAQTPFDLKTGVVASLSMIHTGLARYVTKTWQGSRQQEGLKSPFEMAQVSKQHSN